ncbi:MAG: peptidase [Fibrella sp.]|nr:peptidase [Armatimonadota bacterium]
MPSKTKTKQKGDNPAERLQTSRYRIRWAEVELRHSALGPVLNSLTVKEAGDSETRPSIGVADPVHGVLYVNPWFVGVRNRLLEQKEWEYVLAHLALHLALNHAARREDRDPFVWNLACDVAVDRLLPLFQIARPATIAGEPWQSEGNEEAIYEEMMDVRGVNRDAIPKRTLAGEARTDILGLAKSPPPWRHDEEKRLGVSIQRVVQDTVTRTAETLLFAEVDSGHGKRWAPAEAAKRWVLSEFPLLGALAGEIRIIADAELCRRMDIPVAAINGFLGEMYLQPDIGLTQDELVFVYVHELLHVALFHHSRGMGRDHHLYNIAADFVINGWLVEMGVGQLPKIGALYDPRLQGMSTEEVYDKLLLSPRESKKLRGFRGESGDVLMDAPDGRTIYRRDVTTLDDLYRRCLQTGFSCSGGRYRGTMPAGLLEAIRSLWTAPVPWDVELARWMDAHVPFPRDPRRTYARASRRQASTPDIPRPARYIPMEESAACTFGVVLDTSGSMDRALLGRALGAIASYAEARDVPAVRLVLCDAAPYDRGIVPPTDLRGVFSVQGRGGTVLQPAINFLLRRADFPPTAPIMVITDGWCEDEILCPRDHCFVLPRAPQVDAKQKGEQIPLRTSAPVFRVLKENHDV